MSFSLVKAGFLAIVAAACLGTQTAKADITFCNKSGQNLIYISIAYPQRDGSYLSRGWMSLNNGECAIFDTAIHVPTFFFRAESEWVRGHGRRTREVWGKGQKFAVWDNDNYQYYNAQERVLKSTLEEFTQGPTADNGDVSATVTFTENGSETTVNGAATNVDSSGPKPTEDR